MNKPKTITQLSKEQLEDMCINLMHVDNEKANIIEELENRINKAIDKVNDIYFEIKSNVGVMRLRLKDTEQGQELSEILKGDNDE